MQKLTIIGNLTKDPELRTTQSGKEVCSFTVAVNRKPTAQQRQNKQDPGADYFRVSAWEERGKVCNQYLSKGKKVCVIGTVSARGYKTNQGEIAASLEVKADEIEFLSPKGEGEPPKTIDQGTGYQQVDPDDLPYN
jgi:single-strand DNA-binding protein